MTATCAGPECDREARTRGYCRAHYQQLRGGRELAPLRAPKSHRPTIDRDGCDFTDCDRPHHARGYCRGHYHQLLSGRELQPLRTWKRGTCSFVGCGRPHSAFGLCHAHRSQQRDGRELAPIGTRRPRKNNLPEGWFRKTVKAKKDADEVTRADTGGQAIVVDFTTLKNPPEIDAMAREKLLRHGAGDLLEMLGLEAS